MERITVKDMCRVMTHIDQKVRTISEIMSTKEEDEVYKDVYQQALRESDAYSLDSIEPRYLYDIHEAIDCYTLPAHMRKEHDNAKDNRTDGNSELG